MSSISSIFFKFGLSFYFTDRIEDTNVDVVSLFFALVLNIFRFLSSYIAYLVRQLSRYFIFLALITRKFFFIGSFGYSFLYNYFFLRKASMSAFNTSKYPITVPNVFPSPSSIAGKSIFKSYLSSETH